MRGEIHGKRRNANGHVFFDLVGDGCKLPVVLWSADRHGVNHALKRAGNAVAMEDGTEVRIRCEVQWHAPTGRIQLRMDRIDPAFTLGQLAAQREQLLHRLEAEGLLRAQAALAVPAVPLRDRPRDQRRQRRPRRRAAHAVGVGHRVAGRRVRRPGAGPRRRDVARRRRSAGSSPPVSTSCVLVRGGGARTDLAAFDGETLARTIATAAVPVLTGIGHEVDTSVADAVAWARHVTPTACAEWLVARVRAWCERRDARCGSGALAATEAATDRAPAPGRAGRARAWPSRPRRHLRHASAGLDVAAERLARRPGSALAAAETALQHRAARAAALDPARLLARGWSITRTADGRLVRSPRRRRRRRRGRDDDRRRRAAQPRRRRTADERDRRR